MAQNHHDELYVYDGLPSATSFRVVELLPGDLTDPVSCLLRTVEWADVPSYDALSYAWGDPTDRASVLCHGRRVEVTKSLERGLTHLRSKEQSRLLWADALCINQSDLAERNSQVRQMRRIFEQAQSVLIWLGPDTQDHDADVAVDAILSISDFICQTVGVTGSELRWRRNSYEEVVYRNRALLSSPYQWTPGTDAVWKALRWFYSHRYFTRVWVIQELNVNPRRTLHCGHRTIEWVCVQLVAGYLILDTSFSRDLGFSDAYCWWASTITTELRQPENWLQMLYLASNFSSLDARDVIYGLRGLMPVKHGAEFLRPDYGLTTTEVYRNSVEAAILDFENTDVLLYIAGNEDPSWIPRWDRPMLFRNPFRFGKKLPWNPAKGSKPRYEVDRESNTLSLWGYLVGDIQHSETYNEKFFDDTTLKSDAGRAALRAGWENILQLLSKSRGPPPFDEATLTAVATCFSFGLNEESNPGDERELMRNFVAYLRVILDDDETFQRHIPPEIATQTKDGKGSSFGKPVWDFDYPASSFFSLTDNHVVGCCVSTTTPGDVLCIPLGGTYPLVLRPTGGDYFLLRGFAFVHGVMYGDGVADAPERIFKIR